MAGKFSKPGLYENLSTNNTLSEENDKPGSIITFFTSRPSCKNTVNRDSEDRSRDFSLDGLDAGFSRTGGTGSDGGGVGSRDLAGVEGSGGTGGVSLRSGVSGRERERETDLELLSSRRVADDVSSSSSTSVNTASSPGVNAEDTANDRRFGWPRRDRSLVVEPPVIFEML